jgi:glycosyltransferase involved in cell wall biosynthesis
LISSLPLVSVIIPTYRRSEFLLRAIRSALNQTYKNTEIIIVDDNDGDDHYRRDTKVKISHLMSPQIRYIEHDTNKDVSAARNSGIDVSQGDYIAFLDDDDEWLPGKLEKQIALFQNLPESYGVISCGWRLVHSVNSYKKEIFPNHRGDLSAILAVNHFSPPSMIMIKKSFLRASGVFDEKFSCSEDVELLYRLAKHCFFDYVDECLVNYYYHSGSKSRSFDKKLIAVNQFIDKHESTLVVNKRPWSEIHERKGDLAAASGELSMAIESFIRAYFHRPGRMQIIGKLLLSFLGRSQYVKTRKL